MEAISEFIAAFGRDFERYSTIEKRVEQLCRERLKDITFLWTSRVKNSALLEKKLIKRRHEYDTEAANVADIKDLVGGRIVLARWDNIPYVEKILRQTFVYISRTQHPKQIQNSVNLETRFRGYGALHVYVSLQSGLNEPSRNPIIEIQVMTGFMWEYQSLHHDVVYKQLHGEPTKELLSAIDLLKGVANIGEIGLQMYDERFFQPNIYPDLQTRAQSVIGEENFDEIHAQSRRDLRSTNPQHDKHRVEAGNDRLLEDSPHEERAYALLRKQPRDKEAHLRDVAEARRTLCRGSAVSLRDEPSRTCRLRNLYHLAIAERKLSLAEGLDTDLMMKHLDQAEVYMNEAVQLDLQSGLTGAQEQMTIERLIVRGLKANLENRANIRDEESTGRLLRDVTDGINRALGDLGKVDVVKHGKNTRFALEWMRYFANASS